ncbi:putative SLC9B1-like protein SLC9B1P1 isoform X2 [Arctopsyche grandis]|uniref:putative SLC9B1-like protein SLC9B1P1 isoform X2 n=1 Tax=Arctopsyche grandis TaxID=121162 RepID=UPI00406D8F6C
MCQRNERSRWISFCEKCHQPDAEPSWEPPHWQKICPYPFFPTYRNFAQNIAFVTIILLLWGVLYTIVPRLVSPSSQLFNLVVLIIAAYIGGILLFKLTTLPALIGMLIVGIIMQNLGAVNIEGNFSRVTAELRRIAVVIILTRAGLSLDQPTMKKLFVGILKLGLIPWIVECVAIAVLTHYLLNLPWNWAFLLGSVIASVSPAVVVPCFIRLRSEGYGVEKGIPTLILAAASIDDTTSIAVYGVISSIMFTESSLVNTILQGPLSVIGGVSFGLIWGFILNFVPEKNDAYVVPLRASMLFFGNYFAVVGSSRLGYAGAGPLAVITSAFICSYNWSKQGWSVQENPVVKIFRLSWIVFEPTLFGITGAQVKINELDPHIVSVGAGCLFSGVFIRILSTILICFGSNFNMKEKIFIGLSWMAKATVQAALGPLAIDSVRETNGSEEAMNYANIVLMICILSIILTAPLGAILISLTGPRLLSKSPEPIPMKDQINGSQDITIAVDNGEKEHFHDQNKEDICSPMKNSIDETN